MTTNGVQYSVEFCNNSYNYDSVCIYQTQPDLSNAEVMSLAWFAKAVYPNTSVSFTWSLDYSFVWSQTGTLAPGVSFKASQVLPTNLTSTNKVTLTHDDEYGAYEFTNQISGTEQGTLYITEDGTIPNNDASVGIGMSGVGTFVVQAKPNWNLTFTPHPQYWITFGSYKVGLVLDVGEISNVASLSFPANCYSLVATLDQSNLWTVQTLEQANAGVIAAQRGRGKTKRAEETSHPGHRVHHEESH